MRLTIAAVGRLRAGPEASLTDDYLARATAAGRGLALGPCTVLEIDERKARDRAAQGDRLAASIPPNAHRIALDERGRTMTSPDLARTLARLRDDGVPEACFMIGGADGHPRALVDGADLVLSFGPMVWPHMLVRVMVAEQLYRAVSIIGGSPYHRT